jgi:phosphotransferase system IIA component
MLTFLKNKKSISITSMGKGNGIPIEEVSDEMFASKMLGDGYAVQLTKGEVLLHMGIDTVELEGIPFDNQETV